MFHKLAPLCCELYILSMGVKRKRAGFQRFRIACE